MFHSSPLIREKYEKPGGKTLVWLPGNALEVTPDNQLKNCCELLKPPAPWAFPVILCGACAAETPKAHVLSIVISMITVSISAGTI